MVTTKGEGLHLVGILLRYMSKEDAIAFLEVEQPVEVIEDRALHS